MPRAQRRRTPAWMVACALLILSVRSAPAQDAWTAHPVGDAFFQWRSNWTAWYHHTDPRKDTLGDSAFEIERLRLGVRAGNGDTLRVRLVLEALPPENDNMKSASAGAVTAADPDAPWRVYPQAASVRFAPLPALGFEAGVIDTGWIPYENAAWGFRFIQKGPYEQWSYRRAPLRFDTVVTDDASDRRLVTAPEGTASESDLGAAVGGAFPAGYGDWRIGYYNGEGAEHVETNPGKAADARLSLHPLAAVDRLEGLSFTGYVWGENLDPETDETLLRYGGLIHYRLTTARSRDVSVAFEMINGEYRPHGGASDAETIRSTIFSYYFDVELAERLFLLGRHDHFNPNRKNGVWSSGYKDEHATYLLGVAYEPWTHIKTAFDLRLVSHRAEYLDERGKSRIPRQELLPYLQLGLDF